MVIGVVTTNTFMKILLFSVILVVIVVSVRLFNFLLN